MTPRSAAVFCGSKPGNDPLFMQQAFQLGEALAGAGITLVYGGGNCGLMGAVANGCLGRGGHITGVITELLTGWEHQHLEIQDLRVVTDMHIRKKMMYELADAAIILPGGNGTLDEMFEMMTWNTLSIHNKQIMLLNSGGFYDHLMAHLSRMQEQGFLYENWRERVTVCTSPEEVITGLSAGRN